MLIRVIMRYSAFFKIGALAIGVLAAALCLSAQKQSVPPENPYAKDAPNLPPRATPADYQAQAKAGTITIAAEFDSHSVPTPEGTLTTEDYVVVEAGLFGAPGAGSLYPRRTFRFASTERRRRRPACLTEWC